MWRRQRRKDERVERKWKERKEKEDREIERKINMEELRGNESQEKRK